MIAHLSKSDLHTGLYQLLGDGSVPDERKSLFKHTPAISLSSTFTHFCSKLEPGHSRVWWKIRLNVIFYETRLAWWHWLWHKPATHTGRPYAISKGRLMLQQREVKHFCLCKAHRHCSCCGLHHARQILPMPIVSVVHFLGSVSYPSCMNLLNVRDNLLVMSEGSTENTDF